jgi:hypothetical protein
MFGLGRALHTGEPPMENCWPAIIVSFGVTAHCGHHSPSVSEGEGWFQCSKNRFRGRVSWFDASIGRPRFETLRSAPPKKGRRAMTILKCSTLRRAVVCPNSRSDCDDSFARRGAAFQGGYARFRAGISEDARRMRSSRIGFERNFRWSLSRTFRLVARRPPAEGASNWL